MNKNQRISIVIALVIIIPLGGYIIASSIKINRPFAELWAVSSALIFMALAFLFFLINIAMFFINDEP